MKIKEGFLLRKVGNDHVVVAVGDASDAFHGMIRLNETAAFLWEQLQEGADTEEKLLHALTAVYEVEEDRARKGVASFLRVLRENQILS